MNAYLQVAIGGATGSLLRFGVSQWVTAPWGTFAVNVLGSFAIGACAAYQADRPSWLGPLVMIGILGGFTTFSTFSLDVLKLWGDGKVPQALGYALLSFICSLAACGGGFWVAKLVLPQAVR